MDFLNLWGVFQNLQEPACNGTYGLLFLDVTRVFTGGAEFYKEGCNDFPRGREMERNGT